jgi:hypothetical protein
MAAADLGVARLRRRRPLDILLSPEAVFRKRGDQRHSAFIDVESVRREGRFEASGFRVTNATAITIA